MPDSIVIGMTKYARRLGSFGVVAARALLDIVLCQIRVSTTATSVSSPDHETRNLVTRRKCSAEALRAILVTVIAECSHVVAGLAFARLCLGVNTVGIQVIDVVHRLSRKCLRLVVTNRPR